MKYVLRNPAILARCFAYLQTTWEAHEKAGHPLEVICLPESAKRSSQANRRYWDILRQIAEQVEVDDGINGMRRYSADVWHEWAKREFVGLIDLPGGGRMGESTSNLTSKDFSEYVSEVEAWAVNEKKVVLVCKEAA